MGCSLLVSAFRVILSGALWKVKHVIDREAAEMWQPFSCILISMTIVPLLYVDTCCSGEIQKAVYKQE
jgi:hypothetical protein